MSIRRYESFALLIGDVVVFYISLYLTLFLRHLEHPGDALWAQHLAPFTILFGVWVLVFFIAGLYEQHTSFFKAKLQGLILKTQIVNVALAALFFFAIPYFGITPKTNLLIYLFVSSVLIVLWRLYLSRFLGVRRSKRAMVIGSGREIDELVEEFSRNRSTWFSQ